MKTCKKLFTLALALILLMSTLVFPVWAEEETSPVGPEEIAPRYEVMMCPVCGGNMVYRGSYMGADHVHRVLLECVKCGNKLGVPA